MEEEVGHRVGVGSEAEANPPQDAIIHHYLIFDYDVLLSPFGGDIYDYRLLLLFNGNSIISPWVYSTFKTRDAEGGEGDE